MINEFAYEDQTIETRGEVTGTNFSVQIGNNSYQIERLADGKYKATLNGVASIVACVIDKGKSYLDIDGLQMELTIPSEDGGTAGGAGVEGEKDKVFAPMPGKIVKLMVSEGDKVKIKQALVIVEAMKMEHQVNALADGVVKKVNFADGDQVDTETPIIELEIAEE